MTLPHRATGFGLSWRSDIALDGFDSDDGSAGAAAPMVEVRRVDYLSDRPGGRPLNRGVVYADGIRFGWERQVDFDMLDGSRIAYVPGPDWTGAMPASFYSTVAAMTVAWRGIVPLHACAVEVDGRAVLVAGAAGAGKSTLAAGLVAQGAGFIGDDLTAVTVEAEGVRVRRGRPTMRLHPDTAGWLDAIERQPIVGDPRGKWLVRPRLRSSADCLDLGAILLLDEHPGRSRGQPIALFAHIFRRHWVEALPMRDAVLTGVLTIAASVPMLTYPAQVGFTADEWRRRATEAMALVRKDGTPALR